MCCATVIPAKSLSTCRWPSLEAVFSVCHTFEDVLGKVKVGSFVKPASKSAKFHVFYNMPSASHKQYIRRRPPEILDILWMFTKTLNSSAQIMDQTKLKLNCQLKHVSMHNLISTPTIPDQLSLFTVRQVTRWHWKDGSAWAQPFSHRLHQALVKSSRTLDIEILPHKALKLNTLTQNYTSLEVKTSLINLCSPFIKRSAPAYLFNHFKLPHFLWSVTCFGQVAHSQHASVSKSQHAW